MAFNTQIFQRTNNKKTKQEKATVVTNRNTHIYSKRKPEEDLKQSSHSRYNSHFNLNKQAYIQHEAALQKEQAMPMQLYEANHLYLMNIALITKNLQEKTPPQYIIHP